MLSSNMSDHTRPSFVLFLLIMSYICNGHGAKLSQRYTLRRNGYRLKYDVVSREVTCSSLAVCTAICTQDASCLTVSFKKTKGRCLLSTDRATHPGHAANVLVSDDSGWETISKAVYKVFHVASPLGTYQATYADAVTLCADMQTVLASPGDLLESRALGLSFCGCGWLSDQTNGFILQSANWGCWGSFNTGILYCNIAKANVWCRL